MTENRALKIGGLLLAAGGSSRLGHPKQLVQYHGETLIRRAAKAMIDAGCSPVLVVIGGEVEGSDDTTILTFYQAAKYRGESSLFRTYDDLTEIGALPFARCVFGNFYVLTARNEVWYIDFTGGETSSLKVATSFNDFLSRIIVDAEDQ